MRSYEAARTLFSFLAFCAWSVVIIGVLVALVGAGGGSRYGGFGAGLLAMAPGIGIGIAGLILVAFVQMGRATVDTAEYTQQMLKVARDQLEVSQQGLNGTRKEAQSFARLNTENNPAPSDKITDFGSSKYPKNPIDNPKALEVHESGMIEGETLEHSGHTITFDKGQLRAGGLFFESLDLAKAYIDRTYKE